MKWIRHANELPITKDIYECSETMALWYPKKRKFEMGFWWPIERVWCDGESMGPIDENPAYWSELGPFPNDPPQEDDRNPWFNEEEFEPINDERVLVWRKDLPDVIYMAYYKNDTWMDHDFECPLPAHCKPSVWRNILTPPFY